MHISTLFISILLISSFLFGCASQHVPTESISQKDIITSLKKTSTSDIARYKSALELISSGQFAKAETELLAFTENQPALAGPWANLALISIKLDKFEEAEQRLKKSLSRNPEMPQALNLMGYIEKQRGNVLKARDYFIHAVKSNENYSLAHYNLALVYDIYMQDIQNAIIHYQKYLALTRYKDKKTTEWLAQLKASIKKG